MKLKISFKHLDHTPALDTRIEEKSRHFEKYFQGNIAVSWVCWVHGEKHWAEVKVHGPRFDFFAKAHADNMYKALDLVVEKMERQIEKQKGQLKYKAQKDPYSSPKYLEIEKLIKDEEEFHLKDPEEQSA